MRGTWGNQRGWENSLSSPVPGPAPANNVYTVKYPSTVLGTYMYDQLNRVTGLGYSNQSNSYVYTRGTTGNLTNASEPNGRQVTWSFDGIYRLTNEQITGDPGSQNNGSVGYTLDPVGNRTADTSSLAGVPSGSWSYNQDDELSGETYDQDGNVTAANGKTFSYDSQNEMLSMNGGAVQMMYDGDGNRVAKSVNGVVTRYLVDDLNPTGLPQVMDELNGSNVVTRTYTYGLQRISEDQVVNNTWTPSFYSYDGMGSVRQLTNTAGAVTDSYEYDAFGNEVAHTGTTPNNYLYRGEQFDSDLGLYYLRARYYNPTTGRFMSRDPNKGNGLDPRTLHKYLYAGGDPVDAIDPTGRTDEEEETGIIGQIFTKTVRGVAALTENAAQAAATIQRIAGLAYLRLNDILAALAASEYTGAAVKTFFCISVGVMISRMLDEADLSNDEKEAALIDYKLVCSLVIIAPWNLDNMNF